MVAHYLWKACLMTAILVLSATGAQAESSNPEDGSGNEPNSQSDATPCTAIIIGENPPSVRIQWDCVEDLLTGP